MRSMLLVGLSLCATALADQRPTPLLQDDLSSNKRTKIDAAKDDLDSQLDSALGGPQGFSTQELEKIEDRIRAELKRDRPRATPRLIVFLYPGKISVEKLKGMREINIEIELVMDPCERSVCRESVARHIELVGRSVGASTLSGPGHKVLFKNLSLETSVQMHDTDVTTYKIPIGDCIAASQKSGGGLAWLNSQDKAEQQYEPIVQKAIAKRASARRVSLQGAAKITHTPAQVDVIMNIKGDRNRLQQQTIDALAAAVEGMRENPKTPSTTQIDVVVDTNQGTRRFRAPGNPVGLYVDKQLDGSSLWSSYVAEQKKQPGAQSMSFDDGEASGKTPTSGGGEPDDNEVISLLAANFAQIGGCAKAEIGRNKSFHGVTVQFKWNPAGKAEGVTTKEANFKGGPLAKCLKDAVEALKLPRFSGGARDIEYPIRLK
jgi:hypothetical protein